jgi:hypothetical protein
MEYCERCGPGLFDEPINALTNGVFFVAAWGIWLLARRTQRLTAETSVLLGLIVSIGIGSGLWHTFATRWAEALDRIPILLFQLLYFWLYLRRIVRLRLGPTMAAVAGFVAMGYLATRLPPVLNRSLIYAPTILLFLSIGVYHWKNCQHGRFLLIEATGVFVVAVVFRSIDLVVCAHFPIGTHFLWHILNGGVIYLVMRGLVLNRPDPATTL